MALTTTTICLTLAAGAGYKFFEAMRDYRKLQASTGNAGTNLFHLMPGAPELESVRFDLKLAGACAAAAAVTLAVGMAMSGPSKPVQVAELGLKGSVTPVVAPAPVAKAAPAATPVPVDAKPAAAPAATNDEETCKKQMQDMAASICVNMVYMAAGNENAKDWMVEAMEKNTRTCSRWNPKPFFTAAEVSGKVVLAGVLSNQVKATGVLEECYKIIFSGLRDHKLQPRN